MSSRFQTRILDSLEPIAPADWDRLAGDHPFLRHAFLHALHETGCASDERGWSPRIITLWDGGALAAAMPLYLKSHSYGEYVFDWAWADAYHRHGLDYYPKLLCAVPFTPATGSRLLAPTAELRQKLLRAALELAKQTRSSSLHVLFPLPEQAGEVESAGLLLRTGVQFHWRNPGYRDFADFLAGMTHDKRKKIMQERRRVREAGIEFAWLSGRDATVAQWDFFTLCYNRTYRQHHSTPYLNRAFFRRLAQVMPDNVLLIIAARDGEPIAAALNVHNGAHAVGTLLGLNAVRLGSAFRDLLLPDHRVLHRSRHRPVRRRRPGRAQAGARLPAGSDLFRPLARPSPVLASRGGLPEPRGARHERVTWTS